MRAVVIAVVSILTLGSTLPSLAAGTDDDWGTPDAKAPPGTDPDYQAGVKAVGAKAWPEVIARMGHVIQKDPKNANAWNYMGFAYRQMGEMDNSFKHYEKALQINPNHRGAHEYMGEAYLQVGNLAKAEEHLKALAKICASSCNEYSELEERVAAYKQAHAAKSGG
jgi:cytochrome c-type biogenesis protein CcmH/NrfG